MTSFCTCGDVTREQQDGTKFDQGAADTTLEFMNSHQSRTVTVKFSHGENLLRLPRVGTLFARNEACSHKLTRTKKYSSAALLTCQR